MKLKLKLAILFIMLGIIAGGVYFFKKEKNGSGASSSDQPAERQVTTRPDAETIAKEFLAKRDDKDQYEPDPVSTETYPEFWNVWFATKDQSKRPNRGLVQINRQTGAVEWKELQ